MAFNDQNDVTICKLISLAKIKLHLMNKYAIKTFKIDFYYYLKSFCLFVS